MLSINKRLFLAWGLSIVLSYFALGFLNAFYTSYAGTVLLTVLIHTPAALFVYFLLGRLKAGFRTKPMDIALAAVLFVGLTANLPFLYRMVTHFPNLLYQMFDHTMYQVEVRNIGAFTFGLLLALPLATRALSSAKSRNINQTRFFLFVDENLAGLMVGLFFFSAYMIFLPIFNQPVYDADDIFFDADGNLWRWRFATTDYHDYYWRPAHPFILPIIRPLVSIISLFLKGDRLFSTFILVALTGALCIFLVWYFVKAATGSPLYALLIAALFGACASQIAFSVVIETYIFSAAAALVFLVLLLKKKPLTALIVTGLVAFGITLTNFVQTVIAHFFVNRNFKQLTIYGLLVAMLVIPLSLFNNILYPNSQPFFWELSTLEAESHNSFPPTLQRANLLGRVMFLHSIVSPEPLVIDDGWPFVKTWMFRASIRKEPMRLATYNNWLDTLMAYTWFGLLIFSAVFFFKNLFKRDNGFLFTFILTTLFNFSLYLSYGKDVFLYSANWTYAIVLFFGLSLQELADKRWFQIFLLIFVILLLVNNSQMLWTMLATSAPSVK